MDSNVNFSLTVSTVRQFHVLPGCIYAVIHLICDCCSVTLQQERDLPITGLVQCAWTPADCSFCDWLWSLRLTARLSCWPIYFILFFTVPLSYNNTMKSMKKSGDVYKIIYSFWILEIHQAVFCLQYVVNPALLPELVKIQFQQKYNNSHP